MYEKLFSEGKIGKVTFKNRLVMSPMGIGLAELDGTPGDEMIAYYAARAEGGAGLVIPEITRVNDVHGAGMLRQLSVSQDRHIEPLAKLAAAIHAKDSKIFIQLHHPGREGVSALIGGQPVVSASDIPCKVSKQPTRALTTDEVKELIGQFVAGAARVQKAGCDGVELHCAHGYLLQQFLSPYTNKRTDEYGGSFENRARMVSEIIAGIRKACGPDFPVGIRLSVEEFLDKTGVTEDYIHIQDGVKLAMYFEAQGIDFIDVSVGLYETGSTCVEPISFPQGWRRELVRAVKSHVHIPVIAVGVIREPAFAEKLLEEGTQDFVSMGRSWLCDENWGKKALEGREKDIRKCINCLRCFESLEQYNSVGLPAECALNPRCARELRYPTPETDVGHHSVVVVGGGPAGMAAAETLARRGCRVTLMDRQNTLGGTVNQAKMPPLKERMEWIMDYYRAAFDELGVAVKLGTEATPELIAAMKPDAVIVATGSKSIVPGKIPGVHGKNVYTIEQVLLGGADLAGKQVAMIGAGLTGLEAAEYLASRKAKVTIVDMLSAPAPTANQTNVIDVCGRLRQFGVQWKLGCALKEIRADAVVLENQQDHTDVTVPSEAVVLSLGYRPDNALAEELKARGIETVTVGSAVKDGNIAPAVRGGYEVALALFKKPAKTPSFLSTPEEIQRFTAPSLMDNQEGVYMAYLTDPAAVARLLPPPLKPFAVPVVTLSVCHIHNPSFADDYYETILGLYAMYGQTLGQYAVSLLLGGPGAEMATQCGRDNASIPKKLDAEFQLRRDGSHVTARVARRGAQLIDLKMELGRYNSPLTHAIFQAPAAGKHVSGSGFYFHFDREPDENGVSHFMNGGLVQLGADYEYHSWEPGTVQLKLQSSPDDPFAELPINTIIGGAYAANTLSLSGMKLLERCDAEKIVPYLLTARYDRTAFKETYRK
jgi:2,4-dienoyl-CoA reductase-like NADH-dependent reductase (Old Yellow Enzyme family)/thioredoxin reductase